MTEMTVVSRDGTRISAECRGEGPALVVVSGALFDHARWKACAPLLAAERSVHLLDRRGRGRSGDATAYEPEREVEDVLALLETVDEPADLLGHSSGAILAVQVAERAPSRIRRLVLYEPPLFFGDDRVRSDLPERLDALVAAGDRDAAVQTFLREGPRTPEPEIQGMRASPAWAGLVALAHTVAYDARIQREFEPEPGRLAGVRAPTLMLIGSESPPRMRHGAEAVAAMLPDARIDRLPGQQHVAMLSAPALFAEAVIRFLAPAAT